MVEDYKVYSNRKVNTGKAILQDFMCYHPDFGAIVDEVREFVPPEIVRNPPEYKLVRNSEGVLCLEEVKYNKELSLFVKSVNF